jgi:hypothetical protein
MCIILIEKWMGRMLPACGLFYHQRIFLSPNYHLILDLIPEQKHFLIEFLIYWASPNQPSI